MKDEILSSLAWIIFWSLLFLWVCVTMCNTVDAQITINPYYEKAVQMDAKEEARKCASLILDAVHAEAWNSEFRKRVSDLSAEDQEVFRERIMNEFCLDGVMLERLLDEAEIANTLVGEQP